MRRDLSAVVCISNAHKRTDGILTVEMHLSVPLKCSAAPDRWVWEQGTHAHAKPVENGVGLIMLDKSRSNSANLHEFPLFLCS